MFSLLVVVLVALLQIACCQDKVIVCYVSSWAAYRPGPGRFTMDNIDPSLCTHIIYSFTVLDPQSLTIKVHDPNIDIQQGGFSKVTALKEEGVKVLIAVGGYVDSAHSDPKWSNMMSSAESRAQFVQSVVKFLEEHNFDGLDVDYEYPGCPQGQDTVLHQDMENFNSLLQDLRHAFSDRYLLTVATAGGLHNVDRCYSNMAAVCQVADLVNVMTYDMHGIWESKTGGNAPINEVKDVANHYVTTMQCPPEKIVLGIPLYGHTFKLSGESKPQFGAPTTSVGPAGPYTAEAGLLAYYEICEQLNSEQLVRGDEGTDQGSYAFDSNQFVAYESVQDVAKKADLINELGLRGAMTWVLDEDDFNNICKCGAYPLVKTLNNKLRGTNHQVNC